MARIRSQAQEKMYIKKERKKSIKVDIGQATPRTGDQALGGADGEEGEWASAGVPGSP